MSEFGNATFPPHSQRPFCGPTLSYRPTSLNLLEGCSQRNIQVQEAFNFPEKMCYVDVDDFVITISLKKNFRRNQAIGGHHFVSVEEEAMPRATCHTNLQISLIARCVMINDQNILQCSRKWRAIYCNIKYLLILKYCKDFVFVKFLLKVRSFLLAWKKSLSRHIFKCVR